MSGRRIKAEAAKATVEASRVRPHPVGRVDAAQSGLYFAQVTSGDASAGYTINLVEANGDVSSVAFDLVRTFPGGQSYSANDEVLVLVRPFERPIIIASGGGGGGSEVVYAVEILGFLSAT